MAFCKSDVGTTNDSNCEQQGGGDRVLFSAFCDVDNDIETCEDLSDSDIREF